MGARRIQKPAPRRPNSADDIFDWLVFLCLSSESRGVAGYELAECAGLLELHVLRAQTRSEQDELRAHQFRQLFREMYAQRKHATKRSGPDRAVLHLLGLTPAAAKQPRAERRRLAAEAFGMNIDTFQKRYERWLLRDAAHDVWRLELEFEEGVA